jgi:hypothetical protein
MLTLLLASCSTGSRLIVDLRTDFVPGVEFDRVDLTVTTFDGAVIDRASRPVGQGDDARGGMRIAEADVGDRPGVRLQTTLWRGDQLVIEQFTAASLRGGMLAVTVLVTRDCASLACDSACLGGRCLAEECTASGADCAPDCQEDRECAAAAACAAPACVEGRCFAFATDACAEGEYCNPDRGCSPRGPGSAGGDAGVAMQDAGIDASFGDGDAGLERRDAGPASLRDCAEGSPLQEDELIRLEFASLAGLGENRVPDMPDGTAQSHEGSGALSLAPGPPGCGAAMQLDGRRRVDAFVEIPYDPAFDLSEGSVDFWVHLPPSEGRLQDLLGRDALRPQEGHFAVQRRVDDRLRVRVQSADGSVISLCSDAPVPAQTWLHVGFSFGGAAAALTLDGVPQRGVAPDCDMAGVAGLAGHDNPWMIGGAPANTEDGSSLPYGSGNPYFTSLTEGLRVDHFRVTRRRQDFTR